MSKCHSCRCLIESIPELSEHIVFCNRKCLIDYLKILGWKETDEYIESEFTGRDSL